MKSTKKVPVYGTGALAIAATIAGPAFAAAGAAADDSDALQEVVVTGVRESLRDSIAQKRNSDGIGDNISTKDIGQLPDVTIAEELNRLPGVNTTRDRGNASQASVRGLGPRLVLGLVDGREVASSEPSQDLRWEIYPSELLSGAQVYKTQDASLVPGGIAATVDIRTLSPLDYKGAEYSFRGGPTYNDESKGLPGYSGVGYRTSGGVVKHITDDLAFSLAASAQREKNGFPDFRTWGWNTPLNSGATPANPNGNTGDLNGDGVPDNTTWGLNTEVKEVTQDRYALAGAIAWKADDDVTVKFDTLWSQYHIKENQFQAWYGNNITGNWDNGDANHYNAPGSSYQIVNGSVVAANLNGAYPNYESEIARYNERHTLIATGFNLDWKPGAWDNQADVSFSEAWRQNQWQAIQLSDVYPPNLAFNVADGGVPYGATPGFDPAAPAIQSAGGFRQTPGVYGTNTGGTGVSTGPEVSRDRLAALALSFGRTFDTNLLSGVKFGARVSDRKKTHHEAQWGLCPGTGSTVFGIAGDQGSQSCPAGTAGTGSTPVMSLANAGLSEFNAPSFTAPPLVYGNWDTLYPLIYPNATQPAGADEPLLRTQVTEKSYEGWFRLDFSTTVADFPLTGDLGTRVAHVDTRSSGFQTPDGGVTFQPVSISNQYTDVLPSLNATLHLTSNQLLRFGASIGISRPPLDSLTTGFQLNNGARTGGGGNPRLDPFKADQLDLSYEWYFHEESMFALAPYYKDVKTYIGASQSLEYFYGQPYTITSEANTRGGEIAGVEATFETRFFFLPGFLQDFGIYANHAYAESNVREATPAPPLGNPLPMVGLAKGTSEADLFYNKAGFEARVAVKHHTPFTVAPTWVGITLKTLEAETTLDFSTSYTFLDHWTVRVQGRNLTNERARFDVDNNPQNLANDGGYQVYGRSYLFDVGVKF